MASAQKILNRCKLKTLADIYASLGRAFEENNKFKNSTSGDNLYKAVVRAYAENAIPLNTYAFIINQLAQEYPPAKDLYRAILNSSPHLHDDDILKE